MSQYQLEPDSLTREAIIVRIYEGVEAPVAMLERAGPIEVGAEYMFVPEGAFPVPAQIAVADKMAERYACPVYIRLDGVEWNEGWGELTK